MSKHEKSSVTLHRCRETCVGAVCFQPRMCHVSSFCLFFSNNCTRFPHSFVRIGFLSLVGVAPCRGGQGGCCDDEGRSCQGSGCETLVGEAAVLDAERLAMMTQQRRLVRDALRMACNLRHLEKECFRQGQWQAQLEFFQWQASGRPVAAGLSESPSERRSAGVSILPAAPSSISMDVTASSFNIRMGCFIRFQKCLDMLSSLKIVS